MPNLKSLSQLGITDIQLSEKAEDVLNRNRDAHQTVKNLRFEMAEFLYRLYEKKRYKALGYDTWEACIRDLMRRGGGFSHPRQADRYVRFYEAWVLEHGFTQEDFDGIELSKLGEVAQGMRAQMTREKCERFLGELRRGQTGKEIFDPRKPKAKQTA